MIAAVDDDKVLEPPGDEEFVVVQKAQIAGSQERTFIRICQSGVEVAFGFFCQTPISLRHTRTGDPNLTDFVRRTAC